MKRTETNCEKLVFCEREHFLKNELLRVIITKFVQSNKKMAMNMQKICGILCCAVMFRLCEALPPDMMSGNLCLFFSNFPTFCGYSCLALCLDSKQPRRNPLKFTNSKFPKNHFFFFFNYFIEFELIFITVLFWGSRAIFIAVKINILLLWET